MMIFIALRPSDATGDGGERRRWRLRRERDGVGGGCRPAPGGERRARRDRGARSAAGVPRAGSRDATASAAVVQDRSAARPRDLPLHRVPLLAMAPKSARQQALQDAKDAAARPPDTRADAPFWRRPNVEQAVGLLVEEFGAGPLDLTVSNTTEWTTKSVPERGEEYEGFWSKKCLVTYDGWHGSQYLWCGLTDEEREKGHAIIVGRFVYCSNSGAVRALVPVLPPPPHLAQGRGRRPGQRRGSVAGARSRRSLGGGRPPQQGRGRGRGAPRRAANPAHEAPRGRRGHAAQGARPPRRPADAAARRDRQRGPPPLHRPPGVHQARPRRRHAPQAPVDVQDRVRPGRQGRAQPRAQGPQARDRHAAVRQVPRREPAQEARHSHADRPH